MFLSKKLSQTSGGQEQPIFSQLTLRMFLLNSYPKHRVTRQYIFSTDIVNVSIKRVIPNIGWPRTDYIFSTNIADVPTKQLTQTLGGQEQAIFSQLTFWMFLPNS